MDTIQLVEIKNILNQQLDNEAFINTIDCLNQSDIPKVFDTKISEESEQTIGETLLAFLKNNNIYETLGSDLDVKDERKSRRFQTLMQLLSCVSSEKRQDYIAKVMAEQAFQLDAISYKPAFLIDSSTIPALQEKTRPALLETWAELFSGIELTYPNASKPLLESTQKFLEQYTIYEKIKPELAWFQDNMPSLFKSINPALPGFETDIETSFQALLKYGLEEAEKKNPFPTEAVSQAIKLLSKLSPHPSIYNILKFSESKWQNDILMMAAYYLDNDSVVQLLQIIRQLPPNQQTEIVNKTNDRDWTALCCATLNQKVMPAFIDYIKTLSPEYQAAILGKKGNQGANVLLLAAKNAPNTVPELLALISRLDFKDSQKIIEDAMDKNALMIVARYQPENLPKILEVIQKLDKTVQADILKQASTHGWNALMLVAKYTPENLPKILGIILQLEINEAETIINEPKKVLSFSKTLSALDQAINNKFQDLELELKCSLFLLRQDVSGFQKDASISAKSARLWAETQGLYDACKTIPTDLSGWSNLRQKLDKARSNLKGQAICLNHLERLEVALQEKLHQQEEDLLSQLNALEPSAPPYPKGEPSSFNMSNQKGDSDLDETLTMAYTFPEPPAEAYYVKYAEAQPTQGGGVDNKYPEAVLVQTNEQTEEYPPVTERANNMPLTSPAEELACMRETLPLAEQANQFNLIKQDQKKIKDLKTLFRTDLTAKRDFMMLELASKTEEFKIKMNSQKLTQNQQKNYHQAYEITEKLHKNLTQVITYLNPSSNSPQKLDEAKNLWQAFIKRSVSQLPPSLPKTGTILNEALMGYEPSFFSTLIQTIEIPVSSPFEGAADVKDLPQQTNQIMKNKLKEMKADGTLTLISQIKEESEISTNDLTPDHLTAYNRTLQENALTLAIKMRSRHLPSVVRAIKELSDADRIQVLHVCNQKNLSLISPSQIIFSVCKGNLPAQRALYLLELERLVLSKANESVRLQLNTLLIELNKQPLETNESKIAWINAIQTTRKTLAITEKNDAGLIHWFKSALRFIGFSQTIHQTPEGYGIGLFKPTIRTLLDEMSTFPMTPDQSGRKK